MRDWIRVSEYDVWDIYESVKMMTYSQEPWARSDSQHRPLVMDTAVAGRQSLDRSHFTLRRLELKWYPPT